MKYCICVKVRVSCDSGFTFSQARVGRHLFVDEGWNDRHVKVWKMTLEGLSETLRCRSLPRAADLHVREDASERA